MEKGREGQGRKEGLGKGEELKGRKERKEGEVEGSEGKGEEERKVNGRKYPFFGRSKGVN